MMQQVATTQSGVAAFASGSESSSGENAGANEQFGQLLYDQQHSQNADKQPHIASTPIVNQGAKKPDEQTTEKVERKGVMSVADEQSKPASHASSDKVNEGAAPHVNPASTAQQPASQQDNAQPSIEKQKAPDTPVAELDNKLESLHPIVDIESAQAEMLTQDLENNSAVVVPEHWVSLVDSLQKLHRDNETDVDFNDTSVQLPDSAKQELRLPNHIAEEVHEDKALPATKGALDSKDIDNATLDTQIISVAMQQAFLEASQSSEVLAGEQALRQKALDILLNDPEKLQNLSKLQESDVITTGKDTITTKLDITEFLAASAQSEPTKRIDLTLRENHALLETLMSEQGLLKGQGEGTSAVSHSDEMKLVTEPAVASQIVDLTLRENHALLETLMSEDGALEVQGQISSLASQNTELRLAPQMSKEALESKVSVNIEELSPQVLEGDAISLESEPLIHEPLLGTLKTHIETENKRSGINDSNNILHTLSNLPEVKLDKVIDNIAQRITDASNSVAVNPAINEQSVQKMVNAKASDMVAMVDSTNKDVVAQLKAGLEEFKDQLAQGREPGIDLKALVSEAALKSTDKSASVTVSAEQLVKTVSQVFDVATSLNRALDQQQEQTYTAMSRDVSQIQAEQSKQSQLNLFESKFDKAINITKPEGHQQLAEKVRWMVNTKNLIADIRLDPAELGSMQVKVAVSGESASVSFVVQSHHARDAVDTATPRLREMLAEKGIELGQSSVRQENGGQQEQGDAQSNGGRLASDQHNANEEESTEPEVTVQQNIVNGALGGVDYFV